MQTYADVCRRMLTYVTDAGAPLLLLDLLKLQEKAPREIKLGSEYREAIRCLGVCVCVCVCMCVCVCVCVCESSSAVNTERLSAA
jgi:hypothetical protein